MSNNYDETDEIFFDEEMENDYEEDFDEGKEENTFSARRRQMENKNMKDMDDN